MLGEARAPRYTSYPTAAQFTPAVDAATHRAWLAALSENEAVSIYVHVPYCRRLCWYCGCNTAVANRRKPVAEYVSALCAEIGAIGWGIGRPVRASALHLGGGSPDSLAPDDLEHAIDGLLTYFDLEPGAEFAAELDPAHVSADWIVAAGRLGLNRASLGVQTFAPQVQAAINRPQSFALVAGATQALRSAGVRSINFDLMYGLPRQDVADVEATLDLALRLKPDRLAVFGYAHIPRVKAHQALIAADQLPGAAARLEQADAAAERLAQEGYVRIGLDHYALPSDDMAKAAVEGRLRRNFQGYTTDGAETLIGFGPSAISRLPQGYVQNHAAVRAWAAELLAGLLPTARGVAFQAGDRLRAALIEQIMCDGAVDVAEACVRQGAFLKSLSDIWAPLQRLEALGLVTLDGCCVRLTPAGRPLVRTVCTVFDRYFDAESGRHALTI